MDDQMTAQTEKGFVIGSERDCTPKALSTEKRVELL